VAAEAERPWLVLLRAGGSPPPDHEVLECREDGSFTMWRTIGRASQPSSPVGSFAGGISGDEWSQLQSAVAACASAGAVDQPPEVDASIETVEVGGITSRWGDWAKPPPPWDALAGHLRRLLGELTIHPRAAISLRMDDGSPALVHLGEEVLELDLSETKVRAVRWDGPVAVENHEVPLDSGGRLAAAAGWELPLRWEHPWPSSAVVTCHVEGIGALDGTDWRSCAVDQPAADR